MNKNIFGGAAGSSEAMVYTPSDREWDAMMKAATKQQVQLEVSLSGLLKEPDDDRKINQAIGFFAHTKGGIDPLKKFADELSERMNGKAVQLNLSAERGAQIAELYTKNEERYITLLNALGEDQYQQLEDVFDTYENIVKESGRNLIYSIDSSEFPVFMDRAVEKGVFGNMSTHDALSEQRPEAL